ncbi:MAG: tryptophan--tRNA ligase [Holophagaceae bacterium]|jgi:tryptophanyl-tRNA synthetase|uniref:Tryptophan--tRNA ligase n=1 Tax=Candidatus Geothrix odensensis TaxID=2954440 RepID=A0A936F0P5_9BACT|nr:tryptophan--tRNA ligase [Candidatus Geothrix odensensis]MBK8788714.1 tryptophan--tRNA ligase [Holophagaceae bacterium]
MQHRVLSGIQPSGSQHIGHLVGALDNFTRLQGQGEAFYMIADWHALTSKYESVEEIWPATLELTATFLAAGLDPNQATLFVQSLVKEHAELHLLLSMVTPLSWLERVPTYKEKLQNAVADLGSYGFLGYPLLQTADIIIYKAHKVPVGEDQLFHLELAREVVRRFNFLFQREVFPEPEAVLTKTPKVPGLDGRKMSKSYGNCIYLRDTNAEILEKCTRQMASDPARLRRTDPGNPDICPVFEFHKLFSDDATIQLVNTECRQAGIGCFDCKKRVAEAMTRRIEPVREKIEGHLARPGDIEAVLRDGSARARSVAAETMADVRDAMKMPVL